MNPRFAKPRRNCNGRGFLIGACQPHARGRDDAYIISIIIPGVPSTHPRAGLSSCCHSKQARGAIHAPAGGSKCLHCQHFHSDTTCCVCIGSWHLNYWRFPCVQRPDPRSFWREYLSPSGSDRLPFKALPPASMRCRRHRRPPRARPCQATRSRHCAVAGNAPARHGIAVAGARGPSGFQWTPAGRPPASQPGPRGGVLLPACLLASLLRHS